MVQWDSQRPKDLTESRMDCSRLIQPPNASVATLLSILWRSGSPCLPSISAGTFAMEVFSRRMEKIWFQPKGLATPQIRLPPSEGLMRAWTCNCASSRTSINHSIRQGKYWATNFNDGYIWITHEGRPVRREHECHATRHRSNRELNDDLLEQRDQSWRLVR